MKRFPIFMAVVILLMLFAGCTTQTEGPHIAATTLPVFEFTSQLCEGTGLTVTRLVTEEVSCLHDYSLNVRQVRSAESADLIVISGAGLEEFMHDILENKAVIDSSSGISLIACSDEHDHDHDHSHHHHDVDNHIWLSPENAAIMAENICNGLINQYPEYQSVFANNLDALLSDIEAVQIYGTTQLSDLSCRELITFHDGFAYLAQAFDLSVLKAVEEESGSEASASELKELILLVQDHEIPSIFTEVNGSSSAASVISRETGVPAFSLDMAMGGSSWFDAMYHNIDTLKEALE